MISNTKLLIKNNGNVRKTHTQRVEITDNLKKALKAYFKGLNINGVVIGNYNNGDLRINAKKANLKGYNLKKLFKAFNLKFNVTNETENYISYCIYVFDG